MYHRMFSVFFFSFQEKTVGNLDIFIFSNKQQPASNSAYFKVLREKIRSILYSPKKCFERKNPS